MYVRIALFEKIDGLSVRFHSVAAAESRRDLLDPLTWSMLSPHPSPRSRSGSAVTESVYLFEDCISMTQQMQRLLIFRTYD
ncbi:hypothetical protein Y032_0204g1900 [Ancylostoma ceylanicum]|uniref:Uncharacterized protein n=1 Tax=Ancylostoma ceylanicum TaxID=53326 RepID=A0A016SMM2_9BILA|nr:hypothetical protein Y032_0204g1900 [Ancylostoma ceylanicum]